MTDYKLTAEPGKFKLLGTPIGIIRWKIDENGYTIEYHSATGGASISSKIGKNLVTELEKPLNIGRRNECHVKRILKAFLIEQGFEVGLNNGIDKNGEDGIIKIDGETIIIQVVTLPSNKEIYKRLNQTGQNRVQLDPDQQVEVIREAIESKERDNRGHLLILDASYFGTLADPEIIIKYIDKYGNPVTEFCFHSCYIVGPTKQATSKFEQ